MARETKATERKDIMEPRLKANDKDVLKVERMELLGLD